MNKFFIIAWYEFKRHVFQKRFIFSLLSIPLVAFFMFGMIYILIELENNDSPVGLVDHSQSIDATVDIPESADLETPVEFISFQNEAVAKLALEEEQIQTYFVIPENYPETINIDMIYIDDAGDNVYDNLRALLRVNLLEDYPHETADRMLAGFSPIIRTPDGLREFSARNAINLALPGVTGFVFMFLIIISANYFAAIIAEEKENRTMEILATTVSPNQLIGGKIFGTIGVVFLQVISWIGLLIIAQQIAASQIDAEWLQNPEIKIETILLIIAIFIPSYLLYTSLITLVGATATNVQEGQQVAGIFVLPLSFSFMMIALIIENPNSPLAVAISLFPFTAPTLMPLRAVFTVVPTNQLILCVAILIVCSLGAMWLAARAFKIGMLRYGNKLKLRELFSKASR